MMLFLSKSCIHQQAKIFSHLTIIIFCFLMIKYIITSESYAENSMGYKNMKIFILQGTHFMFWLEDVLFRFLSLFLCCVKITGKNWTGKKYVVKPRSRCSG